MYEDMIGQPEMTEQELTEYLRSLGIKEEGIRRINNTFPLEIQKGKVAEMIPKSMKIYNNDIKKAVQLTWLTLHKVQILRHREVGKRPTEEDFLTL